MEPFPEKAAEASAGIFAPGAPSGDDEATATLLRERWREASAEYVELPGGGDGLSILGNPVMEDWEAPYMRELAAVSCAAGGRVLEVGFGLGISAGYIDAHEAVTEHVIIEANEEVLGAAGLWADEAKRPTTVLGGFWQEVVSELDAGSFDAILFDVFPLSAGEAGGDGEVGPFFKEAARLLRPGGVFTFYFDAGRNWLECVKEFREQTVPKLTAVGFSSVDHDMVECQPRPGCTYAWRNRFLVPLAKK
eukprot:TRINITY_DN57170_c0_g1_i1.p1 TRINITY_DN57170_c0_g1~~TRINITY_DN57170_c0_g1_i1.p1  ORF type:complete len:249 (-),score=71.27 TRINITY_DN57170_c0_g1_i1:215-961(-)